MTSGNLYTSTSLQVRCSKVHLLCTHHTDVYDIASSIANAITERHFERLTGKPYITTQNNIVRLEKFCVGSTNTVGDAFIQFGAQLSADIIGFKTG